MFKCCRGSKVLNTTSNIEKKTSNNLTKSISKKIKTMRKSSFSEESFEHEFLGQGASSNTFKLKLDDLLLTCKKIKKTENDFVENEIKLLKLMSYEIHFPIFYNVMKSKSTIYILYRYIEGIDLFKMIQNPTFELNNDTISNIIFEIARGLKYLFNNNYVHLDIKLENIIIKETKPVRIKIIDLAFCKKINRLNNNLKCSLGTVGYCSPEILLHNRYFHNSDVWSLGIVLFTLLGKYNVFGESNEMYKKNLKLYKYFNQLNNHFEGIDENILKLLSKMVVKNPNCRYSINDVLNDNFFNKYKLTNI